MFFNVLLYGECLLSIELILLDEKTKLILIVFRGKFKNE